MFREQYRSAMYRWLGHRMQFGVLLGQGRPFLLLLVLDKISVAAESSFEILNLAKGRSEYV